MNRKVWAICLILLFVAGCSKNPCEGLDDGVYVYPEKPSEMSFLEAIELYKIPKQLLHCISTEGLVRSCINYPEIRMIWTHSHLQGGFDRVEKMCNGFEELWRREDKYNALVYLYKQLSINRNWKAYSDLENGIYMFNIINHELILAQDEILLDMTETQKTELFKMVLKNQKMKIEFMADYYGLVGMESSLAILTRIMHNDNYLPFMEEFNTNESLRLQVAYMIIFDTSVVDKVITISEEYLETLKT